MKIKQFFIIMILIITFLGIGTITSNASLFLENLDFDVKVDQDGSMNVTEIWNIEVSETNTLFKTFIIDSSKYSEITDVTVKDITDGKNQTFNRINEEMYHVTKGCYYSLINKNNDFEIAWGVDIDSTEDRIYEISYTVKDCIKKYNDCAELYWQFVGEQFEISANSITGKIELPSSASSKEDIKVWGHTDELNGEIYVTDLNKVEFRIDKYNSGNFVEVRIAMPTEMITNSNLLVNKDKLDEILSEEIAWAKEANEIRLKRDNTARNVFKVCLGIEIVAIIFLALKFNKHKKQLNETPKPIPSTDYEYFREIPDENINPAEAIFIMFSSTQVYYSQMFSAIMLDLAVKKYISFEETTEKNEKKKIKINIIDKNLEGLKEQEKEVLQILKDASKDKWLNMKMLEKYFEKHSSKIQKIQLKLDEKVKQQLEKEQYFSKEKHKKYEKFTGFAILYVLCTIIVCIPLIISGVVLAERNINENMSYIVISTAIAFILGIINTVICSKIANRSFGYTQKGIDEKNKWKAFKKYMEEFSLLKEREVPELVLWEKYLVYATAFGISKKVVDQLKVVYTDFENSITANNMTYMSIMCANGNFNTSFINTLNSSVSNAYSSGTGGGGGFSGGGGGGRRRRWWPDGR